MSTLVPTYNITSRSREINNSEESSYVRAFVMLLGLLARVFSLLLLLGLIVATGLVWLWLASFRSGWRLMTWIDGQANQNQAQEKISLQIVYAAIMGPFSLLAIFGDWSQKLISEKYQIQFPLKIDLRQILEKQLGVKLPENSPCLPKPDTTESPDS